MAKFRVKSTMLLEKYQNKYKNNKTAKNKTLKIEVAFSERFFLGIKNT